MELNEAARQYYTRPAGNVTMSSKRQITIPAAVVRELELTPGDKLAVYVQDGDIVLVPQKMDWFEYITTRRPSGIYGKTKEDVDEYIRWVREGWDKRARIAEGDAYVEDDE